MIGADKLGTAAESLEPDGILPAPVASPAFSHDDQTFILPALTFFSRGAGPWPASPEQEYLKNAQSPSGCSYNPGAFFFPERAQDFFHDFSTGDAL
jgi:hypothetical protein